MTSVSVINDGSEREKRDKKIITFVATLNFAAATIEQQHRRFLFCFLVATVIFCSTQMWHYKCFLHFFSGFINLYRY